jgi:hypothetical protein
MSLIGYFLLCTFNFNVVVRLKKLLYKEVFETIMKSEKHEAEVMYSTRVDIP